MASPEAAIVYTSQDLLTKATKPTAVILSVVAEHGRAFHVVDTVFVKEPLVCSRNVLEKKGYSRF